MQAEIEDILRDNFDPFIYQEGKYNIHKASIEIDEHTSAFIDWLMERVCDDYHLRCGNKRWYLEKDGVLYDRNELYLIWSLIII